jgi:hypothetical protein
MAPLLNGAKSERKYDTRWDNVHRGTTIPFHLVTLSQRFAITRQGQQAVVGRGGGSGFLGHAGGINREVRRFNPADRAPPLSA